MSGYESKGQETVRKKDRRGRGGVVEQGQSGTENTRLTDKYFNFKMKLKARFDFGNI